MKNNTKSRLVLWLGGAATGIINGMLGSGGGMIAVPMLKKTGMEQKECHATAVMLIFFLSLFSAAAYLTDGRLQITAALPYIPGGIIGAVIGALLLKKIPNRLLARLFGGVMIYTGIRLILR